MTKRLAVIGPRGAGKSVFTLSLEAALREAEFSATAHELDIYSCTHPLLRGEITPEERERRKIFEVDWDRAIWTRARFRADSSDIVLGDMAGGRFADPVYADRDYMLEGIDGAILVGRYPSPKDGDSTTENWGWLMSEKGIPVVARVHSLLPGQARFAHFVGAYGLDRERGIRPDHPAVGEVARAVIAWCENDVVVAEAV